MLFQSPGICPGLDFLKGSVLCMGRDCRGQNNKTKQKILPFDVLGQFLPPSSLLAHVTKVRPPDPLPPGVCWHDPPCPGLAGFSPLLVVCWTVTGHVCGRTEHSTARKRVVLESAIRKSRPLRGSSVEMGSCWPAQEVGPQQCQDVIQHTSSSYSSWNLSAFFSAGNGGRKVLWVDPPAFAF